MDDASRAVGAEAAASAVLAAPRPRFFARRRKMKPPAHCENCDAPLSGPFCAQCGQHAIDYRRSFGRVFVDALDSFLNWDSRLFASFALLLTRPWKLTIDFLVGKRVRYVHPLRLYLLASVLFFFVVNYWAKSMHVDTRHLSAGDRAEIAADLKKEDVPPAIRDKVERTLKRAGPDEESSSSPLTESTATPIGDYGPVQLDKTSSTPFEQWMEAHAKEKLGEHGSKLELFIKTLFSNLPYMMLCCIPLFALVLKILYVRRGILYIDHLIYALHIHAFAYLASMIVVFGSWELGRVAPRLQSLVTATLVMAAIVLLFLSIRRVYRQSWFMSLLKFFFGGVAYLVVLSLALAVTLFITLALPG